MLSIFIGKITFKYFITVRKALKVMQFHPEFKTFLFPIFREKFSPSAFNVYG